MKCFRSSWRDRHSWDMASACPSRPFSLRRTSPTYQSRSGWIAQQSVWLGTVWACSCLFYFQQVTEFMYQIGHELGRLIRVDYSWNSEPQENLSNQGVNNSCCVVILQRKCFSPLCEVITYHYYASVSLICSCGETQDIECYLFHVWSHRILMQMRTLGSLSQFAHLTANAVSTPPCHILLHRWPPKALSCTSGNTFDS